LVGDKLKKTFAGLVAIITAVFIISLLYASGSPTDIATVAATEPGPTSPDWNLNVTGLVENPLLLNWTAILAMPKTTVEAALICVDLPTQGINANWTGVKLQTILDEAHPSQDAIKVAFYAADGYSTDLPVETARHDDIILSYEKDGTPLNDLRLVVPGKWGYKWISQITRIELVNYNFLGYWEGAGYSDEATVMASSPTPIPFTPPLPNINAPSPSPTTPATSSPSSTPSPSSPSITSPEPTQPTLTPEPSGNISIPTDVLYTIAGSVIAAVLVLALLFIRKRK
jgi:hypothetical protein